MDSTILLLSFSLVSILSIASLTFLNLRNHQTIESLRKQNQHQADLLASKDLSAYAYITANTADAPKPKFEAEPDDDTVAYAESMRKGYLTEDESIYYGSKHFKVDEIPVRYE